VAARYPGSLRQRVATNHRLVLAAVPRRRPAPARRGPRPMGSKESGAGLGRWRRRRTSRAAGGSLVSSSRAPAERGVRKVVRENRAAQSRV